MQAEQAGAAGDSAAGSIEGGADIGVFEIGEELPQIDAVAGIERREGEGRLGPGQWWRAGAGGAEQTGDMLLGDEIVMACLGAFDDIFEFADVAGPRVVSER